MKIRWVLVAGALLLAGCGKDHQGSETYDATILRETQCVAAAERFQLYDDAKKHTEHAKDAEDKRFDKTQLRSDLGQRLKEVRVTMIAKDKAANVAFLKDHCDTDVPQDRFNDAD